MGIKVGVRGTVPVLVAGILLLMVGCSVSRNDVRTSAAPGGALSETAPKKSPRHARVADRDIEDLHRIPQEFAPLSAAAGKALPLSDSCRTRLAEDFERRFFAPWMESTSFDSAEAIRLMKRQGETTWYGVNKRKVPLYEMQALTDNCALESFPSRDDPAISVAPAHLRGLPTNLPLYEGADAQPFDMLSFPQVKLNEPLRVLHTSRDGVWLYVQTGYSSGWVERRNVALVGKELMQTWIRLPRLVIVRDYAPVADGTGIEVFRAKIGTILPIAWAGEGEWRVLVATVGAAEKAHLQIVPMSPSAAEPFPLRFSAENVARIGDQMLGQPYGWGEIYGLRDCSALLRDFFLPFGIWLPRTSGEQIAFAPRRIPLAELSPEQKEKTIREQGIPFLTLLHKPGHIMLYVGVDGEGRTLVFHDAWSIRLAGGNDTGGDCEEATDEGQRRGGVDGVERRQRCAEPSAAGTRVIGEAVITTLQPGKELGLAPGSSLLELIDGIGIITGACEKDAGKESAQADPSR